MGIRRLATRFFFGGFFFPNLDGWREGGWKGGWKEKKDDDGEEIWLVGVGVVRNGMFDGWRWEYREGWEGVLHICMRCVVGRWGLDGFWFGLGLDL